MDLIAEANFASGAKMVLISLFVLVDGGCTQRDDKEKLAIWGEDYPCIMRGRRRRSVGSSVAKPEGELGEQCQMKHYLS